METAISLMRRMPLWVWRVGLIVFGAVPLFAVVVLTLVEVSPWYRQSIERRFVEQIERATGLSCVVESLDVDRGGAGTARNVALRDPETGELAATIRLLRIRRGGAGEVSVDADGLEIVSRSRHRWLTRVKLAVWQSGRAEKLTSVSVRCRQIVWKGKSDHRSWRQAEFVWRREDGEVVVRGKAEPSADGAGIGWRIVRRAKPPARWSVKIDAAEPGVRLAGWGEWLGGADLLGRGAVFQGTWEWEGDEEHRAWEVRGRLGNVDLNRVVTESFPHKLSGLAMVRLERLRVLDGQVVELAGVMSSREGMVSRGLLEGGRRWLGWSIESGAGELPRQIRYDQLSVGFGVRGGRLRLWGIEGPSEAKTILLRAGEITVSAGDDEHTTAALLRALFPDAGVILTRTQRTGRLWSWLDLGNERTTAGDSLETRHVPLRLGRESKR